MQFDHPPRVLITGAGSGVGRACAEILAQDGAELILCDNDAQMLASTSEMLRAVGRFCDVSSEASVAVFAANVLQTYSSIDMVINAAGGGYERTLGMYRVSRALLPALKRGTCLNLLLNIAPSNEDAGTAIFPYASSHQAFQRLSAALAAETRGTPVSVLIACPQSLKISQVIADHNADDWPGECEPSPAANDDANILASNIASLVTKPREVDPPVRRISLGTRRR